MLLYFLIFWLSLQEEERILTNNVLRGHRMTTQTDHMVSSPPLPFPRIGALPPIGLVDVDTPPPTAGPGKVKQKSYFTWSLCIILRFYFLHLLHNLFNVQHTHPNTIKQLLAKIELTNKRRVVGRTNLNSSGLLVSYSLGQAPLGVNSSSKPKSKSPQGSVVVSPPHPSKGVLCVGAPLSLRKKSVREMNGMMPLHGSWLCILSSIINSRMRFCIRRLLAKNENVPAFQQI
jgi:hypothetical protein